MARTNRKKPWNWLRHMKTTSTRRGEQNSTMDMREDGFNPTNRDNTRGNPTNKVIPTVWEDVSPNFFKEVPEKVQKRKRYGEK